MTVKKLSLVKYAGDYWFTLADFAQTRDTEGYSDTASVKSAVRTFVVKSNPDRYIAFRGELQIKNIIQENKNNPVFQSEDFQGTRTAIIHWSMLESLCQRFQVSKEYKHAFAQFLDDCMEYMSTEEEKREAAATLDVTSDSITEARSIMLRQMRQELNRMDKNLEVIQRNREKLMAAINAIESLEMEE